MVRMKLIRKVILVLNNFALSIIYIISIQQSRMTILEHIISPIIYHIFRIYNNNVTNI